MVQKVNQLLNDKAWARWTALVLVASMMFFGYMFVDVMSPIQALMESQKGWGPDTFGTYAASEYIVNVLGFLIIAGVILDMVGDSACKCQDGLLRLHALRLWLRDGWYYRV